MASEVRPKSSAEKDEFPPGYLESNIFLNKVCGKIIPIALLAIALLISGGLLLYFHVNTAAAALLITTGGIIAIGDLVYSIKSYLAFKKGLKDIAGDLTVTVSDNAYETVKSQLAQAIVYPTEESLPGFLDKVSRKAAAAQTKILYKHIIYEMIRQNRFGTFLSDGVFAFHRARFNMDNAKESVLVLQASSKQDQTIGLNVLEKVQKDALLLQKDLDDEKEAKALGAYQDFWLVNLVRHGLTVKILAPVGMRNSAEELFVEAITRD